MDSLVDYAARFSRAEQFLALDALMNGTTLPHVLLVAGREVWSVHAAKPTGALDVAVLFDNPVEPVVSSARRSAQVGTAIITPARRALERPMAIACFVDRAPASPHECAAFLPARMLQPV